MKNAALFERAQRVIPAGVNSPVRAFGAVGGSPPFFERASGAYLRDADGRRYIDYVGSWGPMVAGHTHPAVVEAVQEAASRALSFGAPTEVEVQLAYAIGVADPVSIYVDTFGTGKVEQGKLVQLVRDHFQMTPRGIIESLKLRRPIFKKTAAYGHFGRTEPEFSWEASDKAEALRAAAGIREAVTV